MWKLTFLLEKRTWFCLLRLIILSLRESIKMTYTLPGTVKINISFSSYNILNILCSTLKVLFQIGFNPANIYWESHIQGPVLSCEGYKCEHNKILALKEFSDTLSQFIYDWALYETSSFSSMKNLKNYGIAARGNTWLTLLFYIP